MATYRRDGLLAGVALGAMLGGLIATGEAAALLRPGAFAVGVAGAVALEVLFLRVEGLAEGWEHPVAWASATLGTIAVGAALLWAGGVVAVAALCWGLVAYLVLLTVVVLAEYDPLAAALP